MKKMLLLLHLSILCLTLVGCWSSRELTDISIATTLGIDKIEDKFQVTIQVLNPNEIAGGPSITTQSAISNYSATGATVFEALRQLTTVTPRKLFFSHLRLVIYGEEVAKAGIGDSLDLLIRDHELRTDFTVVIAKGSSAKTLMTAFTPLEKIPADKIIGSLKSTHDYFGVSNLVHIDELVSTIVNKNKDSVLTGVYIKGDLEKGSRLENAEKISPDALVYIDHIGIFKNDQLIDWFNEDESRGFNYITDEIKNSLEWIDMKDGVLTVEIKKSNTSLKLKNKGKQAEMHVNVSSEVSIGDVETSFKIEDQSDVKQIEKEVASKIEKLCQLSINRAKEMGTDIFGFGEHIKHFNYKKWEDWQENWTEHFIELPVKVNVTIDIENSGVIKEPFYYKIKQNRKEG